MNLANPGHRRQGGVRGLQPDGGRDSIAPVAGSMGATHGAMVKTS